jgi:hypothetical protein
MDPTTGETGYSASRPRSADISSSPAFGRPRRTTVQSDIQEAILHPGNVRINVQGAFIVDEEQPGTPQSEDYEHDPKDIRLPNHTAVVSHIAVDVSNYGESRARSAASRDQPIHRAKWVVYTNALQRSEAHLQSSSTSRVNLATLLLAAD